jgi:ornithine carbamoyltransferase
LWEVTAERTPTHCIYPYNPAGTKVIIRIPSLPGECEGGSMKRDIISVMDMASDLEEILELARRMKLEGSPESGLRPLEGKAVGMIFEKSSTRTRVSFEVGTRQLGGHALFLTTSDLHLGRGETIHDTAKVLSRYVDIIVYRARSFRDVEELARHASVPVINALDDREHPCQIAADLLTILEHKGELKGKVMTYLGDGNNVCNSLLLGGALAGMEVRAACPPGYLPDRGITEKAIQVAGEKGGEVAVMDDPKSACRDADVLYTDTWVSMGDEGAEAERKAAMTPYRLDTAMVELAKDDCMVLHCLPAHRGDEITDEVMDGPRSAVFDQAENRLHAQKAIMTALMRG